MANTVNTLKNAPGVIAKMAAAMLADKTMFCKSIDKADESDWAGKNGYNAGDTIYISKPARFIPTSSPDVTGALQDVVEQKVALTLDTRKVVPIALTSAEIATDLALKSWAKRILEPAVSSIAQHIEKDFLQKATQATYQFVGTPGSTVFDTDLSLSAGQKISEMACPDQDGRFGLLSPGANRSAVNARKGLFQSSEEIAKQYKKGYIGTADGFDYMSNNLIYTQTLGNDVTGVQVDTTVSVQGSTTLIVKGLTANTGTVTAGSNFTVAGVNAVHPITKQDLGYMQQFTVVTGGTADGNGDLSLTVSPAMYTSAGPNGLQNITALPQVDANVTWQGSASTGYQNSLFYQKQAFRMASVPLVLPDGLDMAAQETVDGMTIRVIRDYSVLTDQLVMRLDFLGGITATRPEWAVRAYS